MSVVRLRRRALLRQRRRPRGPVRELIQRPAGPAVHRPGLRGDQLRRLPGRRQAARPRRRSPTRPASRSGWPASSPPCAPRSTGTVSSSSWAPPTSTATSHRAVQAHLGNRARPRRRRRRLSAVPDPMAPSGKACYFRQALPSPVETKDRHAPLPSRGPAGRARGRRAPAGALAPPATTDERAGRPEDRRRLQRRLVRRLRRRGARRATCVFSVENAGNEVTEFYLYGEDGLRIVGEVENIGPGLTRDLVVRAAPGDYVTSCRPGMTGDGIRSDFAVSDSGDDDVQIEGVDQETIEQATDQYAAYVRDQASQLVAKTQPFVAAYAPATTTRPGGSTPSRACTGRASRRWPSRSATSTRRPTCARPTWSRARSGPAGTSSRRTCGRRTSYTPLTQAERKKYAADLMANINTLDKRVQDLEYTVDQIVQRLQGPARRGRHREDHRRGGHLVAHRPLGLPGQRRRRPRRLRGPEAAARGQGPGAVRGDRRSASTRCRPCSTSTATARRLRVLRHRRPRPQRKELSQRRRRAVRAALEDDRGAHSVTSDATPRLPTTPARRRRGRGPRRRGRARRLRRRPGGRGPTPGRPRRTPSTARTRPGSSPRRRTGCTSRRST